jgi:hypothetical protein
VSRVRLVFLSSQMSGNAFQRLQRSDPMSFEGIPKRSLRRQTDICVSAGTYPVHIGSFLAAHRWIKRVDYLISFFFKIVLNKTTFLFAVQWRHPNSVNECVYFSMHQVCHELLNISYFLYSFFIVAVDFLVTIYVIKKLKFIIYFIMICLY